MRRESFEARNVRIERRHIERERTEDKKRAQSRKAFETGKQYR